MAIDIKETHLDWLRQACGCMVLPDEVVDLYNKVKISCDRISAGDLHPQVLVLIGVLGCERAQVDVSEPADLDEEDEDEVLEVSEDRSGEVDWATLSKGTPVNVQYIRGIKQGKFQNVVDKGRLAIKFESGRLRCVHRKRVALVKPGNIPLPV